MVARKRPWPLMSDVDDRHTILCTTRSVLSIHAVYAHLLDTCSSATSYAPTINPTVRSHCEVTPIYNLVVSVLEVNGHAKGEIHGFFIASVPRHASDALILRLAEIV